MQMNVFLKKNSTLLLFASSRKHWGACDYPRTVDQNKRQQIGATQAKLICFHLCKNEPRWNVRSVFVFLCLPYMLGCVCGLHANVFCCWLFCFGSGGRNIVVTGSGFDFIQTAVMKIHGNNMTAVEVCVSAASSFLLLLILLSLHF